MKRMLLVVVTLAATLYTGAVIGYNLKHPAEATPVARTEQKPPTIDELLKLVNTERAKYGVAPLKLDDRLNTSAQMKADDEVKYGYFGHVSQHDGKHGYEYINLVGIYCKTDSENLHESAVYGESARSVVDSLNHSPAHHKAMIDPEYTLTGFGINGTQIVEHFCEQ